MPKFVEQLSDIMSGMLSQVPFSVTVSNEGAIRADRLLVQIKTSSASMYGKYLFIGPSGPVPPVPRDPLYEVHNAVRAQRNNPGSHEPHFTVAPTQGGNLVEVACEDFRHGREWRFDGVLWPDHRDTRPVVITVSVTAANYKGEAREHLSVEKQMVTKVLADAIDFETRRFTCSLPMATAVESAKTAGDVIEWLKFEELDTD